MKSFEQYLRDFAKENPTYYIGQAIEGYDQERASWSNKTDTTNQYPVLATQNEAEEILSTVKDVVRLYEAATVADLHELCGARKYHYQDTVYGWKDLTNAKVVPVDGGFSFELPERERLEI